MYLYYLDATIKVFFCSAVPGPRSRMSTTPRLLASTTRTTRTTASRSQKGTSHSPSSASWLVLLEFNFNIKSTELHEVVLRRNAACSFSLPCSDMVRFSPFFRNGSPNHQPEPVVQVVDVSTNAFHAFWICCRSASCFTESLHINIHKCKADIWVINSLPPSRFSVETVSRMWKWTKNKPNLPQAVGEKHLTTKKKKEIQGQLTLKTQH